MKRFIILFTLLALSLSACGQGPTATATVIAAAPTLADDALPVIAVDAEHMITPNLAYEIPAGPGFVLDASAYMFGTVSGPTLVQVILEGRVYQGNWTTANNIQVVRAENLLPPPGFKPLTEFPSGKLLIVAIGKLSDTGRFEHMWLASVNVY